MPPRENWPWEEKVRKNTEIKLFSDEYHGVNCSLPSQSLDLIIPRRPRGQCVSGFVVQASRIRHRTWWIDRDGLGKRRKKLFLGALLEACRCPDCSIQISSLCFRKCQMHCCMCVGGGRGRGRWGRRTRLCKFVCFLDSTKSNPTVCKRFPLFFFHPFRSIILPLPHKTHLHFTKILKKS